MNLPDKKTKLVKLAQELNLLCAERTEGEDYHAKYKKDPELFRKLRRQEELLFKVVRKFQKELKVLVPEFIDWNAFGRGEALLAVTPKWQEQQNKLENLLLKTLEPGFDVGKAYGEAQLKIPSELNSGDKDAQKEIRKRAKKTAEGIFKSFKDRLLARLKTVIRSRKLKAQDYPFDLESEYVDEFNHVADDEKKANQISKAEIIAIIAIAIWLYGRSAGAEYKTWRAIFRACPVCEGLDGDTVPLDSEFDSLNGPVSAPPDPHPNCRCYLDLETKK